MIFFVLIKCKRSDHSEITKDIQTYAAIAILMKKSQFHGRSEHMHSPDPIFKLIGSILRMLECRRQAHQETVSSCITLRISGDCLSMVGSPYRFSKKPYAINAFICYNGFKCHFSQDSIVKKSPDVRCFTITRNQIQFAIKP